MIFGQDRSELRRMYVDAWRKFRDQDELSPLEAQIAGVVSEHPEYHDMLSEEALEKDFAVADGQTNPFLHMGLHLAIREQVSTNRPVGIHNIFNALCAKHSNSHEVEHKMLEALAETLWEAQRDNVLPDDAVYLERLKRL